MLALLLPLKIQNFPGLLFVWLGIFIFRSDRSIWLFLLIIFLSGLFFLYFYEPIINQLFFYKIAFLLEDGMQLGELDLELNILDSAPGIIEFFIQVPYYFFSSFLRPFPTEIDNPLILAIFLENIFITGLFLLFFFRLWFQASNIRLMLMILLIGLGISMFIHSYTVINLGSFVRYKFTSFLPFLIVMQLLFHKHLKTNE
jgi:hypothetical protein